MQLVKDIFVGSSDKTYKQLRDERRSQEQKHNEEQCVSGILSVLEKNVDNYISGQRRFSMPFEQCEKAGENGFKSGRIGDITYRGTNTVQSFIFTSGKWNGVYIEFFENKFTTDLTST